MPSVMATSTTSSSYHISPLASVSPVSTSRAWMSAPHPSLPLLATATSDKTVRVYSLTSFNLISTVSGGHKRSVRSCAWKPGVKGESVLATGSFDASAGIWRRWESLDGLAQATVRSEDGGDDDENDDEEDDDTDGWRFSVILDGHESEIKSVAWNAGGQYLATCSRDKSVWIWEEMDDDNFETIAVLQEHEADVKCIVWHPQEDLLVSSSYDDTIRMYKEDLDDWTCVSVLTGHTATVWSLVFESVDNKSWLEGLSENDMSSKQKSVLEARQKSGPRLMSCSDDLSIRVWQRKPKEIAPPPTGQGRIPSILRSNNIEEEWVEVSQLPHAHDRVIYSIAWSTITGMVVSAGSDGKIVVYKERWRDNSSTSTAGADGEDGQTAASSTEWTVVAELEGGHDVYEINHVCWARRRDRSKKSDDEEVIITTGDDGEVKIWTLESDLML